MTVTEVPKIETESLVKDGKNAKQLVCESCASKILPPGIGTYEEIDYDLPCALQKKQPEGR